MTARNVTLTRRITATPEAVFRYWTDPELLGWAAGLDKLARVVEGAAG